MGTNAAAFGVDAAGRPLKRKKADKSITTTRSLIDGLRSDIDRIERAWQAGKTCVARIKEAGGNDRIITEQACELARHVSDAARIEDAYNDWQRRLTRHHFRDEAAAREGSALRIQLGAALSTMRQPHAGCIAMDRPAASAREILTKLEAVLNVA